MWSFIHRLYHSHKWLKFKLWKLSKNHHWLNNLHNLVHIQSTYICSIALAYVFSITYFNWLTLHILVHNILRFCHDAFQVAYVTIQVIHVFQHKAHQYQVFVLFPVYLDIPISLFNRIISTFVCICTYLKWKIKPKLPYCKFTDCIYHGTLR